MRHSKRTLAGLIALALAGCVSDAAPDPAQFVTAATLSGDVPDGELVPLADLPRRAVPKVTRAVIERAR